MPYSQLFQLDLDVCGYFSNLKHSGIRMPAKQLKVQVYAFGSGEGFVRNS